ncbi:PREDICTED: F-box protein PP2-A13-like [Tarenaya hassleriana]|uniref:F-box protein PP2-A13-like n=1 Tax=Tarenaya hassleriana TaxID=28532 RepID=UPI00053C48BC|nr:PREDICTED: F-box protein PP2-A13-like [Tarenaya hassleriana]
MGASISGGSPEFGRNGGVHLVDVPENCMALIMMRLDPLEICKLARLNRVFRRASSADFIWDDKLPQNYKAIALKVFDEITLKKLRKKDLYARLCRPIPFDGGTKELWIGKNTGRLCLSISSKALRITGIDDRRYWSHIPTDESRFQSVAYVQQIWWFEVGGEFEIQFPSGTYSLFFRVQLGRTSKRLGRRICNSEHIHGWDVKPVRFHLATSDSQQAVSQCYLSHSHGNWVHCHAGDFIVKNSEISTKIRFSMTQIDCTHTKGGLCLDSVLILPREGAKEVLGITQFCRQ